MKIALSRNAPYFREVRRYEELASSGAYLLAPAEIEVGTPLWRACERTPTLVVPFRHPIFLQTYYLRVDDLGRPWLRFCCRLPRLVWINPRAPEKPSQAKVV